MSRLSNKEFKELLTEWNKLTKDSQLNKKRKTINEGADFFHAIADISNQIAQYAPVLIGSAAVSAGITKIKSTLEERKKKKKITELSILFVEKFISELNEDANNDLKANEAQQKYNEALAILNDVKSLSYNDKRYFISLRNDTNHDHKNLFAPKVKNKKQHEKLLDMKNKLFEINKYFIDGNMHFVFQQGSNENIEKLNSESGDISTKMSNIVKTNYYVNNEYYFNNIRLEVLDDIKEAIQNSDNFFKTLIKKGEFNIRRSEMSSPDDNKGEWAKLYSSSAFFDSIYGVKDSVSKNVLNLYFKELKQDYDDTESLSLFRGADKAKYSELVFSFNYEKDLKTVQENFESVNTDLLYENMFNFLLFQLIIDEDESSDVSYTRKAEFKELKEKIARVIPASIVELDYTGEIHIKPQTIEQFSSISEKDFQSLVGILHSHQVRNKKQSNPIKVSLIKNPSNFKFLEEVDREATIKLSEALSREMASQNTVEKLKSILDLFKVLDFTSIPKFILSFLVEHGKKPLYKSLIDYLCSIDSELGQKIKNLLSKSKSEEQQSIDDIIEYFTSETASGRTANRIFQIILAVIL